MVVYRGSRSESKCRAGAGAVELHLLFYRDCWLAPDLLQPILQMRKDRPLKLHPGIWAQSSQAPHLQSAARFEVPHFLADAMANLVRPASSDHDHLFRIKLIGDYGVGKSSLLLRFTDDTYSDGPAGLQLGLICGIDFRSRTMSLDGKKAKMQIWDTAAQERFRTLGASYYKGAHGIVVAFDLTHRESFDNVRHWLEEVDKYAEPGINKMLVGNKCDMASKRAVTYDEARELADELGVRYLETSAKHDDNVNEAFAQMAKEIKDRVSMQVPPSATEPSTTLGLGHRIFATTCCQ